MKSSSCKAKGRRLQNKVRNMFQDHFAPACEAGDFRCAIMGESGPDVVFSPHAKREAGDWAVECKNQERARIWDWMKQAEGHGGKPLCFFTRNHAELYVCLRAEDFMELL